MIVDVAQMTKVVARVRRMVEREVEAQMVLGRGMVLGMGIDCRLSILAACYSNAGVVVWMGVVEEWSTAVQSIQSRASMPSSPFRNPSGSSDARCWSSFIHPCDAKYRH